jgi:hypothetical protein
MTNPSGIRISLLLFAVIALVAACRGNQTGLSVAGATVKPVKVNANGSSGCSTATPHFGAVTTALDASKLAPFSPSAGSALAADATGNVVYLAIPGPAPGPAILKLDLASLSVSTFADANRFAAFDPTVSALTGLAIASPGVLVAVDASTNRILEVTDSTITALAGTASIAGGYADGPAADALFRLSSPTQPAVDGVGVVYLGDPGNNRVRKIENSVVSTIAGSGAAGWLDGTGTASRIQSPDGIAIECSGSLLVTDGSHRLRRIQFSSSSSLFGGTVVTATVSTVAGNGTAGSVDGAGGPSGDAQLFSPGLPSVGLDGTIFWLDRGTGVVRRVTPGTNPPAVTSEFAGAEVVPPGTSFGFAGAFDGGAIVDSIHSALLTFP